MTEHAEKELTIAERMRLAFVPKGTAQIVKLEFSSNSGWMQLEFVLKCIDELERLPMRAQMGEPPTNLEKLAYMLLCDSAYIDTENKHERRPQ